MTSNLLSLDPSIPSIPSQIQRAWLWLRAAFAPPAPPRAPVAAPVVEARRPRTLELNLSDRSRFYPDQVFEKPRGWMAVTVEGLQVEGSRRIDWDEISRVDLEELERSFSLRIATRRGGTVIVQLGSTGYEALVETLSRYASRHRDLRAARKA